MPTSYENEMEHLLKLLAEIETDEDPDVGNEDNGPDDALEENFSYQDIFREHDTESKKDGDSGNEEEHGVVYIKRWRIVEEKKI
ncbi:hypothetical protein AVEN_38739-1 [Araneus ventricosus]|uniref:Uncharacterized protein n=1 Tax=Araneus ventricosus TaxID=182803 RepID=A0A4Y2KFN9_ARAVE|nr:hypothetical protein AVEN_38739-1 [Araneus ventricosus]